VQFHLTRGSRHRAIAPPPIFIPLSNHVDALMKRGKTRLLFWMVIAVSVQCSPRSLFAQGALAAIRESVRTPSAPSEPSEDESSSKRKSAKRRRSRDYHHDDDDYSWFGSLFWEAALYGVTSPIWGPIAITGDDYSSAGYFPEYPYQHGIDGYMMIDPWLPSEPFMYSLQARTEYADNFDGISRIGTRALFDTATRFGIDSEVNYWRESLAIGQHDDLWTGEANLVFRFTQTDWMQMRTGLGMNWLADDAGTDLGFRGVIMGQVHIIDKDAGFG